MDRKLARRTDRYCQFVLVAAREAIEDAALDVTRPRPRRAHRHRGRDGHRRPADARPRARAPLLEGHRSHEPALDHDADPEHGRRDGLDGVRLPRPVEHGHAPPARPRRWRSATPSASIRDGRADVMVAGGSEAPITPIGVGGFYAMRAISQRNDDPETASRPFDAGRDGFVIGEGATIVVLEELEHARARGARIYGEIMGYGCSADAHHFTEPDPSGVNPARAMRMALEEAGMRAERDRLHQRARHVDARRRRRRDARDQAGARRGARLRGAGLVDQVDDRATCSAPPARPSSRSRALALCRNVLPPTINQFEADPVVRPRLRAQRGAARRRRAASGSPTASASAATTPRS